MKNGKIYVAGIGPGCEDDITPAVKKAVSVSDVVVGYNYYFSFLVLCIICKLNTFTCRPDKRFQRSAKHKRSEERKQLITQQ